MASTSVTIRMDENLKRRAEALFEDMGLNMTTAVTVFVKAAVRQNKIPFEISGDPVYSEENMERLRRSIAQMESTGGTVHEVDLDD